MISYLLSPFLWMALTAGLAASVASGIVGSYVVVKRIVSISGSIAHSVLGGIGLFLFLKRTYGWEFLSPLHGALLFGLLSAWLIGWVHIRYKEREDTLIGAIWSTGMALGVIFISLTPGYNVELESFLFGNILWVTKQDIWLLLGLDGLIAGATFLFYKPLLALCFDEENAKLQKVPTEWLYLLLLSLIALTVVLLIQIIGAILVIALLAIPAATAALFTRGLWSMMLLATGFGALFSLTGLFSAYLLNWPPGATIALVAALAYTLSILGNRAKKRRSS